MTTTTPPPDVAIDRVQTQEAPVVAQTDIAALEAEERRLWDAMNALEKPFNEARAAWSVIYTALTKRRDIETAKAEMRAEMAGGK